MLQYFSMIFLMSFMFPSFTTCYIIFIFFTIIPPKYIYFITIISSIIISNNCKISRNDGASKASRVDAASVSLITCSP